MLDKKTYELLNKEVDGMTTPAERSRVLKILEKSREAQREFDELKELTSMLRNAPEINPPGSLNVRILNAVNVHAPRQHPTLSPVSTLFTALTTNIRYRYAYAFAGGAVAGILLFVVLTGIPSDTSSLVGTMASDRTVNANAKTADIDLPGIQGNIVAERAGEFIHASISLESETEIEVVLDFSDRQLQFESFRIPEDAQISVSVGPGQIRLSNAANASCIFVFRSKSPEPTPLHASILAGGTTVSRQSLTLEQKSNQ